jgi:hypothetical protein
MMEGAEDFDFLRQPDFVPDPFLKGSYAVYKKETLIGEGTGKLCHIHRPEIIDARGRRCWGDLSIVGNCLCITIPEKWLAEAAYPVVVDPTIGTTTVGSQYLWDSDPPEPWISLMFEGSIPVNRFLVNEAIGGNCTAHFYINEDDRDNGGRGVIYSDNGNKPHLRRSMNEAFINMRVNTSTPAGWRSGSFSTNGSIPGGSYIWFGCFADFFWFPRFDFGSRIIAGEWFEVGETIPNNYPPYYEGWHKDFKLSMYFTYTSAQNYIRTLTQGVSLTDNRNLIAEYKRNIIEQLQPAATSKELQTLYRILQEWGQGSDNISFPVMFFRSLQDTATIKEILHHAGTFFRGLFDIAEVESEAISGRVFFLTIADTVQAAGLVFRGLFLTVCIVTGLFIRDFILSRFLKARSDILLKSSIQREIVLESKIY